MSESVQHSETATTESCNECRNVPYVPPPPQHTVREVRTLSPDGRFVIRLACSCGERKETRCWGCLALFQRVHRGPILGSGGNNQ